jgi:hypothetical protein
MKRKISLVLLVSLLASLASCGSNNTVNNNENSKDTTVASETTATEGTTQSGIISTLTPKLKEELGLEGYEFNVMLRDKSNTWSIKDLIAEAETGDILNDATYKRNIYLEENYGFTLKAAYSSNIQLNEITTLILSGDDTYDAYFPMARTAATAATQGLLYNLKDLKYLNLDHSCWNSMFNDALSFNHKLYYATGAITTNSYDAVRLFMFNKTLQNKYKLPDPYELVRNGKWTIEAVNEMAVAAASDLNGDTVMGLEDQWGMAWQTSGGGMIFYYAAGENITTMDKDELPVISIGSERSIKVYDRIVKMISDKNTFYIGSDADILTIFQESRSLFLTEVLDVVNRLRPYDVDFGLLPLPKFDEEQEKYVQYVDGWCISPIVVPVNNTNLDRTGFIIQALAEASAQFLTGPYYDIALSRKALRDNESAEMLDIVVNNFVLENTDIYQWGSIVTKIRDAMVNGDDLSSIIAANKSALEGAIAKTVEALK